MPQPERGPGWHAFVDRLLEMRAAKDGGSIAPAFIQPAPQSKGRKI
jgi:hypothetical protein